MSDQTLEQEVDPALCKHEHTEMGYGLAGGGIGAYEYCTECCTILHKTQDQEMLEPREAAERELQRISFASGNVGIEHPEWPDGYAKHLAALISRAEAAERQVQDLLKLSEDAGNAGLREMRRAEAAEQRLQQVEAALRFYADEWRGNMIGDGSEPGLSHCFQDPSEDLLADAGRKARAALGRIMGGEG